MVANIGVNSVSKINRRRAGGQLDNVAFGRKDKDLVLEEIGFQRVEKFLRALDVFLPLDQVRNPLNFLIWLAALFRLA